MDIGQEEPLQSTNPIMLGLALNFSVFYYEIEGDAQKACDLARDAYNGAVSGSGVEATVDIYSFISLNLSAFSAMRAIKIISLFLDIFLHGNEQHTLQIAKITTLHK